MKNKETISLCPNCYCVTKTIKGNCGKCGEMKKKNKKREEFKNLIRVALNLDEQEVEVAGNLFDHTLAQALKEVLESIVDDLTEKPGETGWSRAFNERLLEKYRDKLQLLKKKGEK